MQSPSSLKAAMSRVSCYFLRQSNPWANHFLLLKNHGRFLAPRYSLGADAVCHCSSSVTFLLCSAGGPQMLLPRRLRIPWELLPTGLSAVVRRNRHALQPMRGHSMINIHHHCRPSPFNFSLPLALVNPSSSSLLFLDSSLWLPLYTGMLRVQVSLVRHRRHLPLHLRNPC